MVLQDKNSVTILLNGGGDDGKIENNPDNKVNLSKCQQQQLQSKQESSSPVILNLSATINEDANSRLSIESDNSNSSFATNCSTTTSDPGETVSLANGDEMEECIGQRDGYLEPFLHQVGGHGSVLSWDRRTVCKPFSLKEQQFYEDLHPQLREFVPEYRGTIEISLVKDHSGYVLLNVGRSSNVEYHSAGQSNLYLDASQNTTKNMRKSESSNIICKRKSVGRIKLKRSGSLELEMFRRPGRRNFNRALETSTSFIRRCSCDCTKRCELFSGFSKIGPFSDALDAVGESSASNTSFYAQNPWAMECQARQLCKMQKKLGEKQKFILLENLACDFHLPCVLDLKMGFRQHGDDAPLAKRNSQMMKCKNSTSSVLGVRMCGMQVYHADSGVFKCYNKYYGRALSVDGFKREISKFWHNGRIFRWDLLPKCVEKLKALKEVVVKCKGYGFYSSSLLIIYDGEFLDEDNMKNDHLCRHLPTVMDDVHRKSVPSTVVADYSATDQVIVKMIDFEHATIPSATNSNLASFCGASDDQYDKGYVEGITNLINIFSNLCSSRPISTDYVGEFSADIGGADCTKRS